MTPHDQLTVTSRWMVSTDTDIDFQTITYFTDNACTIAEGTTEDLIPTQNTHSFTGIDGADYYFIISATDLASNTTPAVCSPAIFIDTSAPLPANNLRWQEISPHDATLVTAEWDISTSGDVASYDVQFYSDGTCSTPEGGLLNVTSATTLSLIHI